MKTENVNNEKLEQALSEEELDQAAGGDDSLYRGRKKIEF